MAKILICATTTGYQTDAFRAAALRMGHEVVLATDRCHILDDPWGDQAIPMFEGEPPPDIDAVVALGDKAAVWAAEAANKLAVRFSALEAVERARDKSLARAAFRKAGMLVPDFSSLDGSLPKFPCVLKPAWRSASQGVIRANNPTEFQDALRRLRGIAGDEPLLVESYIPGREFAIEGLLSGGRLQVLAIFDKPDPLEGPFFEETIYITPSREPAAVQQSIIEAAWQACDAIGLTQGPVHAEMRVNDQGVWMLEVAARPIGGLCSRVLPGLEEAVIRNALGERVDWENREPAGVMMIPIPREGIYRGVAGLEEAATVPGIEEIVITAKIGQHFQPPPEGASYLGFIFARGGEPEAALREAHRRLNFDLGTVLPVRS